MSLKEDQQFQEISQLAKDWPKDEARSERERRFAVEYWPKAKNSGWYPTRSWATLQEAEEAKSKLENRIDVKQVRIREV